MTCRHLPTVFVFICDFCGTETPSSYGNRPPRWVVAFSVSPHGETQLKHKCLACQAKKKAKA